eukprot:scaffold168273_cov34-Prasinocladus_malaysianus.AAC.1
MTALTYSFYIGLALLSLEAYVYATQSMHSSYGMNQSANSLRLWRKSLTCGLALAVDARRAWRATHTDGLEV